MAVPRLRRATPAFGGVFLTVCLVVPLACASIPSAAGRPQPVSITNSVGMRLVQVPAGRFLMGSPGTEPGRRSNEGPRHEVRISQAFYMGQHEVTRGQFSAFVEATGYRT